MKKIFVFAVVMLAASFSRLEAAETIAQWSAGKSGMKADQNILNKINRLPMPFSSKAVNNSGFTVQSPHFWEIKVQNDVYHAAIMCEDYPDGMLSDSQRFISLFMIWKNGRIHYRQVIENDPEHIKITGWELSRSSDKNIYLSLEYDFRPYFADTFTSQSRKCRITFPITEYFNAPIAAFEALPIGSLKIRNGEARAAILPRVAPESDSYNEKENYRRKNPVYQLVFPHCYMVKNGNHTFHIALVDRQHEDLLAVYIWKDRKPHSIYLLDHYEQFYSTPDRMKIKSGPGSTSYAQDPAVPVWDSIYLKYVITNRFSGPDWEHVPSTSYYKFNSLSIDLKNPGTYDMRKQQFERGFVYTPQLKDQ